VRLLLRCCADHWRIGLPFAERSEAEDLLDQPGDWGRAVKRNALGWVVLFLTSLMAFIAQAQPFVAGKDLVALAEQYENGESVPRSFDRALAIYCDAAQRDDARAEFHLGWMYLNGRGVARDDATAVTWFRKAAAHGMPQAENLLSLLSGVQPRPRPCPTGGALASRALPAAIRALADNTARDVGISAPLLLSVMAVESDLDPRAVSPKFAVGLMQLTPETAARFGVTDRFDPRENVRGGAIYLRSLLDTFHGNLDLALAAYNAGEGAVIRHGGVPPYQETTSYVAAVKRLCGCGQ
jgi:soluble lytic murein transglycosylase-like protein